jgi:Holliday junction resolvase-like predicted endonuclease
VDLVCRVRGVRELVFVEVKTRSSEAYGAPAEAVDWEKQRRIVLAASEWYAMLEEQEERATRHNQKARPGVRVRFDVIEVLHTDGQWEIRHWTDAFTGKKPGIRAALRLSRGPTEGTSSQNVHVEVGHRFAPVAAVVDDHAETGIE